MYVYALYVYDNWSQLHESLAKIQISGFPLYSLKEEHASCDIVSLSEM